MAHHAARRLVPAREAASYASVSESTIRRLVARRDLVGHRIGRRILRIDLDELDQFLLAPNDRRATESELHEGASR